jgi:hypothetical protein
LISSDSPSAVHGLCGQVPFAGSLFAELGF